MSSTETFYWLWIRVYENIYRVLSNYALPFKLILFICLGITPVLNVLCCHGKTLPPFKQHSVSKCTALIA